MCIMRIDEEMKHEYFVYVYMRYRCIVSHLTAAMWMGCNAKWMDGMKKRGRMNTTKFDLNTSTS